MFNDHFRETGSPYLWGRGRLDGRLYLGGGAWLLNCRRLLHGRQRRRLGADRRRCRLLTATARLDRQIDLGRTQHALFARCCLSCKIIIPNHNKHFGIKHACYNFDLKVAHFFELHTATILYSVETNYFKCIIIVIEINRFIESIVYLNN